MKKIAVIAILIFIFALTIAYSVEVPIKAAVDKTKITVDEVITYKIIIESFEKSTPVPQLPEVEGFYVLSRSQSSRTSFSGGGIKAILGYTFILAPTDTGKFTIGPASIKIKNKTYSTDSFQIEVTQGKSKPEKEHKSKPYKPKKRRPRIDQEEKKPQITL